MKRVIYLLSLLVVTGSIPALAQDRAPATITWGEELKEPSGSVIEKVIPMGKELFAVRRKQGGAFSNSNTEKIFLERYSDRMRLKKSQDYTLKYKSKKLNYEDVILLGGNLYLLSSFHNQAKRKNFLFYQKVNTRTLRVDKNFQKVAENETRNRFREGYFDYHISRDSSKLLIYNKLPYKKGKPERFSLQIYDDQFQLVWDKKIALPYNDERFNVEEYRVDNQGNVYLLGVIYKDRSRKRRKGRPTYQYTIIAYTQQGTDVKEYKIDFRDKFITDLTFRVADDGNLVCSGFYSEKNSYSVKGSFFFRLDAKTKEIYNKNLRKFDFNFLTENLSNRKKEKLQKAERSGKTKKQAELYSYDLNELVLRSDGGALLVAEQYYIYESNNWDIYTRTYRSDFFYNYNDIIIVNIRPDGEIEWTARIPKRQETRNDGGYYSSYAMSIVRDKLYFIYNDNSKNFKADKKANKIYNFNGSRSLIALSQVSQDGSVRTFPLFNNREAEIITRPKICRQIGKKEMVIYGEKGRRYRFANLAFD